MLGGGVIMQLIWLCMQLFIITIFGLQQYTTCNVSTQNKEIVTNTERSDGFGAQFQTIIATVIYAESNNKKYVYTPFKRVAHNYYNVPDFIKKKEWLINFIGNFEINTGNARPIVNLIQFFEKNLIRCANSHALKKIKNIFRANKNVNDYFNNEHLNIAIHVRRPNPHDDRIQGANTADNVFLTTINRLRVMYSSKNPLFHLYSQGNRENFTTFNAQDVVLHLNESIEDTFSSMVLADVLVTGASSFSYAAGLLSEGIVYYMPFWHSPLPHWIPISKL